MISGFDDINNLLSDLSKKINSDKNEANRVIEQVRSLDKEGKYKDIINTLQKSIHGNIMPNTSDISKMTDHIHTKIKEVNIVAEQLKKANNAG